MNDHDLLIELSTQMKYLIEEVHNLRDGVKKDISTLFLKADILEKVDTVIKNDLNALEKRVSSIESTNKLGVQRSESNKAYIWRKVFETALPIMYGIIGAAFVWAANNHIFSYTVNNLPTK